MENWKSIDIGSVSPIYALSITTQEWGLEAFPSNLVGINGTWPAAASESSPNQNITTWNKFDREASPSRRKFTILNTFTVRTCEASLPPWDDCYFILESVGRSTVGPRQSSIVHVAYGLSLLISLLLTAVIMGCMSSAPRLPLPRDQSTDKDGLDEAIETAFNEPDLPPARRLRRIGRVERAYTESNVTRDIRRCTELLREMYSLDLEIWGMKGAVLEEEQRRIALEQRAEAVFSEVRQMTLEFKANPDFGWTAEERGTVGRIYRIVEEQGAKRGRA